MKSLNDLSYCETSSGCDLDEREELNFLRLLLP